MAKKYILPQIFMIDMESEDFLGVSRYSVRDNVRSYGITGGGYANDNIDTESKNRINIVDMDDDDDW